ncbi:hypothetical protein NBRC110019_25690 [Neptunitalea chrysea]|uniref:Uncharacterized protein n=1 Tax=Neptunitalea chrysea TaxID=1647581 RepID=A0A9W6EWS9_9FLAO|nr:hypothetical protein [Neptunitalea chrysea]GLB53528.1 hypothetical protein NBRC110019_25690 [Neptunitalea chrysea]
MKRLLLFLPVFLVFVQGFAQKSTNTCDFMYSFEIKKCDELLSNRDKYATFAWDFSKLNFTDSNVQIEVVPVLDCWNEIHAKDFRDSFKMKIEEAKGEQKVYHIKMMAKCFKYRLVISSGACEKTTEWNYFSFID